MMNLPFAPADPFVRLPLEPADPVFEPGRIPGEPIFDAGATTPPVPALPPPTPPLGFIGGVVFVTGTVALVK